MLTLFLGIPRLYKRVISVLADTVLLSLAFWGGFWVRLDDSMPIKSVLHWQALALLVPITIFIFMRLGLYRAVLRYVGFKVLWTVVLGVFISTMLLVMLGFFFTASLPRTVPIIYFSFAILLIGGTRLFFRMLVNHGNKSRAPVIIYGAGSSGRQLQQALSQGQEFFTVAFVDDSKSLVKTTIQGINVYSPDMIADLIERFDIKKVLLAIPSASRSVRQEVIRRLEHFPCVMFCLFQVWLILLMEKLL